MVRTLKGLVGVAALLLPLRLELAPALLVRRQQLPLCVAQVLPRDALGTRCADKNE
jgi:hypothetical protein